MIDIEQLDLETVRAELEADCPDSWLALATAVIYLGRKLESATDEYYDYNAVEFLSDIADATLMLLS